MTALDSPLPRLVCPECGCVAELQWREEPGLALSSWDVPGQPTRWGHWPWVVCARCNWEQRGETGATEAGS